jgi:hypothetical protein
MILMRAYLLLGPLERVGREYLDFARGHFRAQKSLDFQGPPLAIALEMDVTHIKIISSRPIETTGTLILNS